MKKQLLIALISGLVASSAIAESRISASATASALSTTARVKFKILVPRILYLRVGDAGNKINEVTFTVGLSAPLNTLPVNDQVYSLAIPPTIGGSATATDDDTVGSDGVVEVRLWTNNGSPTLNCAGLPLTSGTDTIPLSDITVTNGGPLAHPGASLACTSTAIGGAGVNNLSDTWTYAYAPTTLPPTGTYTTEITYTAAQP